MRIRRNSLLGVVLIATSCGKSDCPPVPPPQPPKPVVHGAAGDRDLRVFLAELASAKACDQMRGQFRPLRAPDRPGVSTGVLWIRDCDITRTGDGDDVMFHLAGNGWQWANQRKKKAGATFELAQDVRFAVDLPMPGALDVAYDRSSHVVSLWFSPAHVPEVAFTPVGQLDVDEKGVWASVLGGLSTVFGSSPESQARTEASHQGTDNFERSLADGLSLTIQACTGLSRFNLGRPAKGEMVAADVGETHRVPVELHPDGMMITGPYIATKGMTARFEVDPGGRIRAAMMCRDQAEQLAAAYVAGTELPEVESLAVEDLGPGKGTVHVGHARCPVAVVVREIPVAGTAPVTFSWQRPPGESARSTGGALIACPKPTQTASK